MGRENWDNKKIFERLLNNKTKKTYWQNINELRKRSTNEIFDKSVELLDSKIDKEKIIGIDLLSQFGLKKRVYREKSLNLFFSLLNQDQSPSVLYSILVAIGHNNSNLNRKRISKLQKYIGHNFSDVRFGLANSLSGIEDGLAIKILIELTKDKHPKVRDWATFSIGTQIENKSEDISRALWKRIDDSDRSTKLEAIAGLAKRRDPRIKDILIEELNGIDNHGSIILESIEDFNDIEFIKLLENQLEINKISKTVNENWIINTIEKLRTTHNKV